MDLISVIVPIFNVEKYLERCIQSIVNQTYQNLEIILVDDGSPDNCPAMCDEWAEKDKRIKVIHKQNGGVSSARNAGINAASGDYIGFVDPDDAIDKTMYECMLAAIKDYNLDVCCCNRKIVSEDGSIKDEYCTPSGIISGNEILVCYIAKNYFFPSCVNKLYKSSIINQNKIFFDSNLHSGEDFTFNYLYLKCSSKICVIEGELYCYYIERPNSLTKHIDAMRVERWKNLERIIENEKDNEHLCKVCKSAYYQELISCLKEIIDNHKLKELHSSYEKIISRIRQNYSEIIKNDEFSKLLKFNVKLIKINPHLYIIIHKINKFLSK